MAAEETLQDARLTADEIRLKADQIILQLTQLASEWPEPTTDIVSVAVQIQFKDGVGNVLQVWSGELAKA